MSEEYSIGTVTGLNNEKATSSAPNVSISMPTIPVVSVVDMPQQVTETSTEQITQESLSGKETDQAKEIVLHSTPEVPEHSSPNEVATDKPFSFAGFQVVRGEFFAHLFEPSVTFKDEKVSVNAACIRKLPTVEFVQFLVHPEKKMLAVKPCTEDSRDSFRWCSSGGTLKKRKPKTITCRVFYAKVMKLMGWNSSYRYKILGKLICTPTDKIFVFDLSASEAYQKRHKDDANVDNKPRYSENWKDQFGVPIEDHDDAFQIGIFDDRVVFRIDRDEESGVKDDAPGDHAGI